MSLMKLASLTLLILAGVSLQDGRAENLHLALAAAEEVEPYVYHLEDGQATGIDYEIVYEALTRAGVNFELKSYPRPRITLMLGQGYLDGLLTTTGYNDKDALNAMWLSSPLYTSTVSAFVLKKKPETEGVVYADVLKNCHQAGVLRGFNYRFPSLDMTHFNSVVEVNGAEQLVKLTMYGRVDCAITEDITFMYQARRLGYFNDVEIVDEVVNRPVVIALSRKIVEDNKGLDERINQAIEDLKSRDVIDNIIIKYLSLGAF
ncbi:transporter substrate-binding domain-containing protein [Hahella aquimaris]|uniref:substrate-binding periplasmic protein n=1 Tax=Hahella sp. HNIBRBA332 TaxID=3015983 RepID=UPI00273C3AEB|nr:transporter substrate-binding domain-containing protein [Hahella sp. HNIBRBA332]WLQ13929.1 transporter substrate-binding domain-containing protein [Hahella sp. HNIBRBA332]